MSSVSSNYKHENYHILKPISNFPMTALLFCTIYRSQKQGDSERFVVMELIFVSFISTVRSMNWAIIWIYYQKQRLNNWISDSRTICSGEYKSQPLLTTQKLQRFENWVQFLTKNISWRPTVLLTTMKDLTFYTFAH